MILLGVDGGGTKTHAVALNERGNVVGSGVGGGSCYHSLGLEKALAVIDDAAHQALGAQQADFAVLCLSCCDSAIDEANLSAGIAKLNIASAFRCYNDTFAALRAGSTRPYGVAVICGTGFNACAITPDGRHFKLFSLGRYTGDWGGGYSMGEAAMGAIYRADDGRGEATVLTDMVLQALGKPDLATLADDIAARRLDNRRVAGLAPLIFDAAEGGDGVARGIIQRLADEIVITASAMLRRGDMGSREADVVLSGGVMHGRGSLLLNSVTSQLAARHPNATVQRLAVAPVVGAAWLAYDALKLPAPTVIAHHFPLNTPVTPSAVS